MRVAAALLIACVCSRAQFRASVPLVIAPTTVTDSKGQYVDGLTTNDLTLYDNNVPQTIQLDWTEYPISLVVLVQTSSNSGPVIDKLGGTHGGHEIDIWKLRLDGTGKDFVRLTHFNDYENWKASNPVVSTDGKFMAFQIANTHDEAGVGYGLVLYHF